VTERFRTVGGEGEAAFAVRGSEFIGQVAPVADVAAAEAFVADRTAAYDDATHNVPAYRVRDDPVAEWASDEGEPAGSAGKPALNVLQQEDLLNVVAVVTRYYGGTKLGVGGLARAYARSVKAAVDDAGIVERRPTEPFTVVVEYDDSGSVRSILESTEGRFEASYEETVTFDVRAPLDVAPTVRDRIRSATSGRATIEVGDPGVEGG
jgi:uncharacterized YigZ family protein